MTHAPGSVHAAYRMKLWVLLWDRLLGEEDQEQPSSHGATDQPARIETVGVVMPTVLERRDAG
jgi:hypothetical protein